MWSMNYFWNLRRAAKNFALFMRVNLHKHDHESISADSLSSDIVLCVSMLLNSWSVLRLCCCFRKVGMSQLKKIGEEGGRREIKLVKLQNKTRMTGKNMIVKSELFLTKLGKTHVLRTLHITLERCASKFLMRIPWILIKLAFALLSRAFDCVRINTHYIIGIVDVSVFLGICVMVYDWKMTVI